MSDTSDKSMKQKAKDRATEMAEDVADTVAERAKSEAASARDTAAAEAQKAANAAEAAAGELDEGSMQAQALESVARRIDELAEQVRHTDIDRAARMIGDAARRNPLVFIAGAALVGFAATRFLKARDPDRRRDYDRGADPWDYQGQGEGVAADPLAYRSQPDMRGAH